MKIVIQRVMKASLTVEGKSRASINQGLVLLVGIGPDDVQEDLTYAVRKITNMRIFSDEEVMDIYKYLHENYANASSQIRKSHIINVQNEFR